MPRLILLNGPPGVGKSTLARRWVAGHPGAAVVEIDELRTSIEGWQDDEGSKLEARQRAVEVTSAHLRDGSDVLIPQYLGRVDFIEELERTARSAGAAFVELMLTAAEDDVVRRFEARRADLDVSTHPEADVDDVRAAVTEATARLMDIQRQRAATIVIAANADVEATSVALLRALSD